MSGFYNYDTRGASHASQIITLERMVEERDAEIERLRKSKEADFEVYHAVYMTLLNAGTNKYLGALEQAQALVARLDEAVACCTIKDNRNLWLEIRLKKIMARCADLLDEDQFNDLDAIATATVSAPAVCPECLGTGMGGTGGICRCKCGTNSASVTDVTTTDKSEASE